MLWGQIIPNPISYLTIEQLWLKFGHMSYCIAWTITYGIFAVWLILKLLYHCPIVARKCKSDMTNEDIRPHLWVRAIGNIVICSTGIILFLIGQLL